MATPNVEVTGAARLYRAASVWTAGLEVLPPVKRYEFELASLGEGNAKKTDKPFEQGRALK